MRSFYETFTGRYSPALLALANTSALAELKLEEPLLSLRVTSKGIAHYVYSGGCTKKSDFQVYVLESYPVKLQLVRTKPDVCKVYLPDGVKIFFSWDEIGMDAGMPFRVKKFFAIFYRTRPVQAN